MIETAHTVSLISQSKSSSSFDTSNSDPTSFILNERETRFASGMERHRSDLSRSIRHQEIFDPQTGNFGYFLNCVPKITYLCSKLCNNETHTSKYTIMNLLYRSRIGRQCSNTTSTKHNLHDTEV